MDAHRDDALRGHSASRLRALLLAAALVVGCAPQGEGGGDARTHEPEALRSERAPQRPDAAGEGEAEGADVGAGDELLDSAVSAEDSSTAAEDTLSDALEVSEPGSEGGEVSVDTGLGDAELGSDTGPGPTSEVEAPQGGCADLVLGEALGGTQTLIRTGTLEPGEVCSLSLELSEATLCELTLDAAGALTVTQPEEDEPGWKAPLLMEAGSHPLVFSNDTGAPLEVTLTLEAHGAPPQGLDGARSLTFTEGGLLEEISLGQLMAMISPDGHGGALLHAWFQRFASTAHSERLGPLLLLDAQAEVLGPDPETWDLDLLPFHVTGVHNRVDLAEGVTCGELRVSMASHDPVYEPFHLIFLFHQEPQPGDVSPGGAVHCTQTALDWARLSEIDDEAAYAEALSTMVWASLSSEAFSHIESVEFIVSPWEWRQWFLEEGAFDNRPLFQTIDIPALNTKGALRDEFLAWVESEAEGINARQVLIPEAFRAPSARLAQGIPWVPLDLSDLADEVSEAWPELRQNIELMGCPGCHSADADFIHTLEGGSLSPFYQKERDARLEHLESHWTGSLNTAPYGPLQSAPVMHP